MQRHPVPSVTDAEFPSELHPLLRRVFIARGARCSDDVDLSMPSLLPPSQLMGIDPAADLIIAAIESNARILIVGDFDADGATSCALAIRAFEAMGHSDVRFIVPNRFEYGYGLTPEIVELAKPQNPSLIITVDNGISSVDGVAAARAAGIDVLVTDHHLPGEQLPDANVIVNPNQHGCKFPSKALAGVGVIFYVMSAVRTALRNKQWFNDQRPEPSMADFLDLVALGTVADVVPLDKNNRILVEQGLRRIRVGKCCAGIRALIEVSGRSAAKLVASDMGFALGPRLNAAGRLDDISIGIACLLTDDAMLAQDIATELDSMNRDRRQIEQGMQLQAEAALNRLEQEDGAPLPIGMCLFNEEWHQGVVGILASRIKDRHQRPVICFALANDSEDCSELKGSARSIKGFHIRDALDAVAARHPGLIDKFGGHAMAAGLSLNKSKFAEFSAAFNEEASRLLTEDDLQSRILSDGELSAEEISLDNALLINYATPWGQLFPEPIFDNEFLLVQQRIVGSKHLKLVLGIDDGSGHIIDAIAFNVDTEIWPDETTKKVKVAYRLDVNRYRGRESVQLMIEHIEKVNGL
ncbi:single-stranded-DNA-specific exonuclease RecJ [Pseudomonadales bacterium]|nr:single-stranded-DNA-specific exonuclease RecJ [Pseudomonadales bacterium]